MFSSHSHESTNKKPLIAFRSALKTHLLASKIGAVHKVRHARGGRGFEKV